MDLSWLSKVLPLFGPLLRPAHRWLSPPNLHFEDLSEGQLLSQFPEMKRWRRVRVVNRGGRWGVAPVTAEDCHGTPVLQGPRGKSEHPLAFVEDFPAAWAVSPPGQNPCEAINIPANDNRVWVSLYLDIIRPTVMEHDRHRLPAPPRMNSGRYIASWRFIQNLGDRKPLNDGSYKLTAILECRGLRWESQAFEFEVRGFDS